MKRALLNKEKIGMEKKEVLDVRGLDGEDLQNRKGIEKEKHVRKKSVTRNEVHNGKRHQSYRIQ